MSGGAGEGTGVRRARAALAVGSKSFALAGKLLPRRCRDDAAVVYAFCRRADDLVDESPPGLAPAVVARLRDEVDRIFAGLPLTSPVLAAFQEVVQRRGIPRAPIDDLLAGFEMDARPRPVTASWDELLLYCYRVAGTVGLLMCRVMGVSDPRALRHAAGLGMAMQLTNICRDLAEDWRRGRLYVPRAALPPGAPALVPCGSLGATTAALLAAAMPILLMAAQRLYRWGDAGLPALSFRSAVAVRTARLVYSAIGDRLAARGHDPLGPRAVVPRWRKLWLAARALVEVSAARLLQAGRPWRPPEPAAAPDLPPLLPAALPASVLALVREAHVDVQIAH